MKLFIFSYFLFISLAQAKNPDTIALVEAVETTNQSLPKIKEGSLSPIPCNSSAGETNKVILAPHFSSNGVINRCEKFFDNKGELGPWGDSVIKAIKKLPPEEQKLSFFSNTIPDMNFICPQFSQFSNDLKLKFWAWTFASIAWQESSCQPTNISQGINCRAIGLLQLEDTRELRKSRGPNCGVLSVMEPNENLSCGVEILHQQLLGSNGTYFKNIGTGELFWQSSYWQHLRLKDKGLRQQKLLSEKSQSQDLTQKPSIKDLIMRFPYCL
jgi:hypothetical protein